ncbi:MAG TPA: Hsp20/alpha crystallin family protein [Gemmataceae bacterium]|nr:Hsp20/alpha crystallin family protein [Gemmataceae bacterium]
MFSLIPWTSRRNGGGLVTRRGRHPLDQIREEFDTLFDRFFGRWPSPFVGWDVPGWGLDVEDTGSEVVVRADAPGFEPNEFDVQVVGNVLTIRAEHKQEAGEKGKERYSFAERRLHRRVTLPEGTDPDKVEARYRNGVLELRLAKRPETQPKRIEVKT